MIRNFIYASDGSVIIDLTKISESTWDYLIDNFGFDVDIEPECIYADINKHVPKRVYNRFLTSGNNNISIIEFIQRGSGKLYNFITTPTAKKAWFNIACAISSSVTLYFMDENGYPAYINLTSQYTISKTNKTMLYLFPPPIVHILASYSLYIDVTMGMYQKDAKWYYDLMPDDKTQTKYKHSSDTIYLQSGTLLSISKYKKAVIEKQIQWNSLDCNTKKYIK